MDFRYEYCKEYQTLQQFDKATGRLIGSLSLPLSDLDKISFLAYAFAMDETFLQSNEEH